MTSLLNFLNRFCSPLFEKYGFRFKDSKADKNPAASSWILLESEDVQIYISKELAASTWEWEITWQMRSMHDSKKKNWFSFDLISQLLGRQVATGFMDDANSKFLSENIDTVIKLFRKDELSKTLKKLNELKAERIKRI